MWYNCKVYHISGYRYVNAAHQCLRDVLIVKKKTAPSLSWLKIRYRPETKGQFGGYKLCQQFTQNKPCKVGEEKCTFAHHQAEINLWSMDRDGSFNVENFVTLCRTYKICKFLIHIFFIVKNLCQITLF